MNLKMNERIKTARFSLSRFSCGIGPLPREEKRVMRMSRLIQTLRVYKMRCSNSSGEIYIHSSANVCKSIRANISLLLLLLLSLSLSLSLLLLLLLEKEP